MQIFSIMLLTAMHSTASAGDETLSRTAGTETGVQLADACARSGAPVFEIDRFGNLPDWFSSVHFEAALREQLPSDTTTLDGLFDTKTRAEQDELMKTHSGVWLVELFPAQDRLDVSFSGRCAEKAVPVTFVGSYEPMEQPEEVWAASVATTGNELADMAARARAEEEARQAALKREAEARALELERNARIVAEGSARIQTEATGDYESIKDLIDKPAALYAPTLQTFIDKYDGATVSAGEFSETVRIPEVRTVQRAVNRIERGNLRTTGQRQRRKWQASGFTLSALGAAGLVYGYQQRQIVLTQASNAEYSNSELQAAVERTNLRLLAGYSVLGSGLVMGGAVPLFIPKGTAPRVGISARW